MIHISRDIISWRHSDISVELPFPWLDEKCKEHNLNDTEWNYMKLKINIDGEKESAERKNRNSTLSNFLIFIFLLKTVSVT